MHNISLVNNLSKFFERNKIILIIFGLFIVASSYKLFNIPKILFDEPLYSYTALNFSELGFFYHDFSLSSGKEFCLYPFILGILFKLFGPSFELGRLLSLSFGIGSFLVLTIYCKIFKYPNAITFILLAIFTASNTFFVAFRIIRPESLLIFGFLLLALFLRLHLEKNQIKLNSYYISFLLGFSLSIVFATHYMGFIYSIPIFIYLLFYFIKKRDFTNLKYFCIGLLPISALLIYNFLSQINSNVFLKDLAILERSKTQLSLENLKYNFSYTFLEQYVMGIKRIYIVMIEILIIGFGLIKGKKNNYLLIINLSTLIFLILGFSSNFSRPYYIIITQLVIINLSFLFYQNIRFKKIINFIILIYVFNLLIGNIYYLITYPSSISIQQMRIFDNYIDKKFRIGGFNSCWFINPNLEWIHQNRPYIRADKEYSKFFNEINMPNEKFYWFNHARTSRYYESKNPDFYNLYPFNQRKFSDKRLIHSIKIDSDEKIDLWEINPI
ncbi:hypothetical protein OA957_00335 [Prochlorococcus sp. AH-716-B04]|nr:hypothetical protein [Prochlorococcus sp. AH-716-B04]